MDATVDAQKTKPQQIKLFVLEIDTTDPRNLLSGRELVKGRVSAHIAPKSRKIVLVNSYLIFPFEPVYVGKTFHAHGPKLKQDFKTRELKPC